MTNERHSKKPVSSMQVLGLLAIIGLCCMAIVPAVAATAGKPTAATSDPWSGTWDTRGSTTNALQTVGVLTLAQSGIKVTGTFSNGDNGKGTVSGTITGNQLVGTWTVDYGRESDNGPFTFVLSDDKKSFSGTWVSASDTANTLSTSPEFWDGARR
ncbi:hypothetical protein [Methanoregula sp.]|uniref:hypothetical protein n=1 Tax=Methanoregula sp. TaxID=2052170 RepID=UPI00236D9E64|nr:hypothetical protein [Methanoregula sp.]MDD1687876.1 hypothetical protein [Methanoregula sp.]